MFLYKDKDEVRVLRITSAVGWMKVSMKALISEIGPK